MFYIENVSVADTRNSLLWHHNTYSQEDFVSVAMYLLLNVSERIINNTINANCLIRGCHITNMF